ncbi:YibE/F family protein [Thermoactinospora rubra]|uniref:YibE/F family protein n=1 Tax=Thermoactinospora rubra TaxID=1088767 RepID=UPI000A105AC4|nr:YibE/F family protein [Thermoactinospora rubra]
MGAHHHDHVPDLPASGRARLATLAVLVPLALATLVALVVMWPSDTGSGAQPGPKRIEGTISAIALKDCPEPLAGEPEPDPETCGEATVRTRTEGLLTALLPSGPGSQRFQAGDEVIVVDTGEFYQVSDHDRTTSLWWFGVAFALAVVAFGRLRGLASLAGLAVTFVILLTFIVPGILQGQSPLLVAVVGASTIMLTVLYLTHGFTLTTSMAVLGTLVSLTLTALLSYGSIGFAHLSGITDESALYLGMSYQINTEGLLLAGIIIGSLGVLDDVTVTQAATVAELARANPEYGFAALYRAAARVGRAHIASVINTIVLAYAGASLPLLILISVAAQPLGEVLANPAIAQEIVRSVVGTLGLIAAVPITTALTALTRSSRRGRHRG